MKTASLSIFQIEFVLVCTLDNQGYIITMFIAKTRQILNIHLHLLVGEPELNI